MTILVLTVGGSHQPILTAIEALRPDRVGEFGSEVLEMRLFGSKATGQDVPGSDIDILVVVREARVEVEDRVLAIAFDVKTSGAY